jgi:hypothetical protein
MKRTRALISLTAFIFLAGAGFSLDYPASSFIDSAGVRSLISATWLAENRDTVLFLKPAVYPDLYGQRFSVSQKKDVKTGFFTITVSPSGQNGLQGTWILYRRLSDGVPDHILIYPEKDADRFVTVRASGDDPEKGKSLVTLSIFGATPCRNIPAGIPFSGLYTLPFSDLVNMTKSQVPWNLFMPDTTAYSAVTSAIKTIREQLGTLVYRDDGAFDENGKPVHIKDGSPQQADELRGALAKGQDPKNIAGGVNCSGFAKWLVDGIIRPRAGAGLFINPLKNSTATAKNHFTEPFAEDRDLFFGLDWTRNLASAAETLESGRALTPDVSGVDVTVEPFAGSCVYELNVGYPTAEIMPLLYVLAIREPGTMYLGAISDERGDPRLRQFYHVAAFFPWFDEDGQFRLAVFESATETVPADFFRKNQSTYINLVRIHLPEPGYFQP